MTSARKKKTHQLVLHDEVDGAREEQGEEEEAGHGVPVELEGLLRDLAPAVPLLHKTHTHTHTCTQGLN